MYRHLKHASELPKILLVSGIFLFLPLVAKAQGADSSSLPEGWYNPTHEPRIELVLSSFFADSATEGSFGVRGAIHLKNRFHLEGNVRRIAERNVDLWLVDLSAKYYLRDRDRTDVYLIAGPGLFYSSDLNANEATVHFGLGAEIALGQRFYIRPELRGFWFTEHLGDTNIGDLSVGFGWRL